MYLEDLFSVLNKVLPNKVSYAINDYDGVDNASMPYIVYQEVSKLPIGFSDDFPIGYRSVIQVTLVTKKKDIELEKRLEDELLKFGMVYSVLTESTNSDKSVNRIYELKMEEFKYEQ